MKPNNPRVNAKLSLITYTTLQVYSLRESTSINNGQENIFIKALFDQVIGGLYLELG